MSLISCAHAELENLVLFSKNPNAKTSGSVKSPYAANFAFAFA